MTVEISAVEKVFVLSEAKSLLPLLSSITTNYADSLSPLQDRLSKMLSNDPRRSALEHEYENIVRKWQHKVQKLGLSVAGLWSVLFDVGDGYLVWTYPDKNINFWRSRQAPYKKTRLSSYITENNPDWTS